jgi:hypothetical protein
MLLAASKNAYRATYSEESNDDLNVTRQPSLINNANAEQLQSLTFPLGRHVVVIETPRFWLLTITRLAHGLVN